ncbi:SnoaL-like domain-containing protein [Terrimonas alba]|uniref:SnoaL-like domain-containing protein n=1 Tax=Terrimonas alba TaxID=3349636 RepID=UPI0035F4C505
MTNSNVPLNDLLEMLKKGEIAEAQEKYFADDVQTQEANGPVISGKANAKAALAAFQAANNVTGFIAYEVGNAAVNGNHSFYNVALVLQVNGKDIARIEQVASTTWKDGKIINERYYHG